MTDVLSTLRLIRSENVGPRTFFSLVKKFGSPAEALRNIPQIASKNGRKITICSESEAEKELKNAEKLGINILSFEDEAYPEILKQTYDPAPILYYKGNLELLQKPSIGVVGTRNASANACSFTRKICAELARDEFIITSGLARGIDAEAHKATLETGTIAVVAGGLDKIYPPENEKLFHQIAEQGLILGENPPGTEPIARHFPQRNRIIAGLSSGVLVVEAAKKSGSLITADFAAREGREVFAVPGSPLDPRNSGTNYLLKNGAVLVESAQDIIENIGKTIEPKLFEISTEYEFEEEILVNVEEAKDEILAKLSSAPVDVDELARLSNFPISTVNEVLLELEITGQLSRTFGNKVSLRAA